MATEEEKPDRVTECLEDVRKQIALVHRDFLELAPQEWVMRIMKALRKCALNVQNYKEFREGLVETGALVIVVMEYSDHLFRDYLSKPAPKKVQITDEERIMRFPGGHLPPNLGGHLPPPKQ